MVANTGVSCWLWFWMLFAAVLVSACSSRQPLAEAEFVAESIRSEIHARADVWLENAILIKPAGVESNQASGEMLSPLILQEITQPLQVVSGATNGAVYFSEGEVLMDGRPHRQITYYWLNAVPDADRSRALPLQGVRITTDSLRNPVIWEVFADTSGAALIFVAHSVEAAAKTLYGTALPGRRFVVEGDLATMPDAEVARVIDDGPIPMGPIVHLRAGTGDVSTLVCRCMPSQVKNLAGSQWYDLVRIDGDEAAWIREAVGGTGVPVDLEQWLDPGRLERMLRLPRSF